MSDSPSLLHMGSGGMPRTFRYLGLGARGDTPGEWPGFGQALGFTLARKVVARQLEQLLAPLRTAPTPCAAQAAEAQLLARVETRAARLDLPEGCLVVPWQASHEQPWPDALSVLAVLTKVADPVWLRSRPACLRAGLERQALSLLVPPRHAALLRRRAQRTRRSRTQAARPAAARAAACTPAPSQPPAKEAP